MRAILKSNDIIDRRKHDAKAMYILLSSMDAGQLEYLLMCETSTEMWKKLSSFHEQRSESNKLLLMTKFHDYKMSLSDSVAQHIAKIENMARQLSDLDENLSKIIVMAKILGSLPSKFSAFVTAWDSVDPERQTLETLTTRLIKEDTRLTTVDDTTNALAVVNLNKSRKTYEKKGFLRRSDSEKKTEDERKNVECFYCHEKDHVIKYCPKKKRKPTYKQGHGKPDSQNNKDESSAFSVVADLKTEMSKLDLEDVWLTDSGASKHITYQQKWFHDCEEIKDETVTIGNGAMCEVKRRGTVYIKRKIDGKWLDGRLDNVFYVPAVKKNLFSVGECDRKGYSISFSSDVLTISKEGKPKAVGMLQSNNLYRMIFQTVVNNETNVTTLSNIHLWHERLWYMSMKTMREMVKQGILNVGQIPEDANFFCESCQLGKQHRRPFSKREPRCTEPGDLIHTDVGGPT